MPTGREAILARVRASLADGPATVAVPRDYGRSGTRDRAAVVDLFVERVGDYEATVVVTAEPVRACAEALATARRPSGRSRP